MSRREMSASGTWRRFSRSTVGIEAIKGRSSVRLARVPAPTTSSRRNRLAAAGLADAGAIVMRTCRPGTSPPPGTSVMPASRISNSLG